MTEIPVIDTFLASLRQEKKQLTDNPELNISTEEKVHIRSLIIHIFPPDDRFESSLEQASNTLQDADIPQTPEIITDENAAQLIQLYAPIAARNQIEDDLRYLQELQPAPEAASPSGDTFSQHR